MSMLFCITAAWYYAVHSGSLVLITPQKKVRSGYTPASISSTGKNLWISFLLFIIGQIWATFQSGQFCVTFIYLMSLVSIVTFSSLRMDCRKLSLHYRTLGNQYPPTFEEVKRQNWMVTYKCRTCNHADLS